MYCISCKKYPANKNSSVKRTKQTRLMQVPNFAFVIRKNRVS